MALSEKELRDHSRRLLLSRMRLLCNHSFYGLLLMHLKYALDESCDTAYTDGTRIAFNPRFLNELSDRELDFVMMHEILHVALQHCLRGKEHDAEQFNIACDIVVNSNILKSCGMDRSAITLRQYGEAMNRAPDGKDGFLYTAEEVYAMLSSKKKTRPSGKGSFGMGDTAEDKQDSSSPGAARGRAEQRQGKAGKGDWDDHTHWQEDEEDSELRDVWVKRLSDAATVVASLEEDSTSRGTLPLCAERLLRELRKPQTDWRTVLNEFVQEEICDYSFSPPDRRFPDSPFFLPDFNGTVETVKNILFMIDTSGSMSDKAIAAAYAEICGAIEQFDGKLEGLLGFFDAAVFEPRPFESVTDVCAIRPRGGGGTDFQIVFEYVARHMAEAPPASIIILTDGYAPFPKESLSDGIPVLWLLNNDRVEPPWGKVARITI